MNDQPTEQSLLLNRNEPLPGTSREDLPTIMQLALNRAGWHELTAVQSRTIPYIRARRDVMVQAQTGSGKTGAFVLPILERVNLHSNRCQIMVLTPTRELAQQVAADARLLAGDIGMRTAAVYGGPGYKAQLEAFKQGA